MNAYEIMVTQIATRQKLPFFLLPKSGIIKPVESWIATLTEEEKNQEIVRMDGKPPIKVRDIPKVLAEDKDFREFWKKKSIAYYDEFLKGEK